MSWIKVESNIAGKPQVDAIARVMGLSHHAAVGLCVAFWAWADGETEDGCIPHASLALVDRQVGADGFGKAMVKVGWLIVDDGGLMVPNFDRHMGESAKSRALAAERQRRFRDRKVGAK